MAVEPLPTPFIGVLRDINAWLEHCAADALIIGGVAASILGRPRMTRDVDVLALVADERWPELLGAANAHGLEARVEAPLEFARKTRVLLLRHRATSVDVDVIFGGLPFEQDALRASLVHDVGGVRVRLPAAEDLITMKALAQRPQDWRDIEGLLDTSPAVDLARIRSRLSEFAAALARSDFLEEFDRLIAKRTASASTDRDH